MNVQAFIEPEGASRGSPPRTAISESLSRVLTLSGVAKRSRLQKLLTYIVDEELAGRGERVKAFSIAVDVFGRDDDFDPQTDSIVRVEMFRLRQTLRDYYAADGCDDPVRVTVPKGSYRPVFTSMNGQAYETSVEFSTPSTPVDEKVEIGRLPAMRHGTAAFLALVFFGAGYFAANVASDRPDANPPEPSEIVFCPVKPDISVVSLSAASRYESDSPFMQCVHTSAVL